MIDTALDNMAAMGGTHTTLAEDYDNHAIETSSTSQSNATERREEYNISMSEATGNQEGKIDYEKMERQAIGVTRIETLWRHFGTNRPVLTALGLSIFRQYSNPRLRKRRLTRYTSSGLLRVYT